EVHEILWSAIARGWRKVAGGLISPRAEEGMLHHGQEFDVGEAELVDVVGELGGHLAIRERTVVVVGHAHPRAEVDFINGLRGAQGIAFSTLLHPVVVVPLVVEIPYDGRGMRRRLVEYAEGIGFVDPVTVMDRFNVKFVERALRCSGDEAFPNAR